MEYASELYEQLKNKKEIIIFIETINNECFGCFIQSKIDQINEYIEDKKSCIFKIRENKTIEKYKINDKSKSIKIFDNENENLIEIGNEDIIIKKEENKNKCKTKILSNNGNEQLFEIKQFYIYEMYHELNNYRFGYSNNEIHKNTIPIGIKIGRSNCQLSMYDKTRNESVLFEFGEGNIYLPS